MLAKATKGLTWLALLLAPIKSALLAALGLVFVDLVLGILAARKRGERITSYGLRRTTAKVLCFEAAIVLAFIVEHYMMGGMVPLTHVVSGFIGMHELASCYENLQALTGQDLSALVTKIQGGEIGKTQSQGTGDVHEGP